MVVMDVKKLLPASRIDAYSVVNPQGENLGKVENMMVDPDTGRVAFLIVSFGGFLGLSNKWIAIPMEVLRWNVDRRQFVMDVPQEVLKRAPGLDKDNWRDQLNLQWLDDVYTCFGCQPFWTNTAKWVMRGEHGVERLIISAEWLKGHKIMNAANEDVGNIEDLIIDLQSGYLTYAIINLDAYEAFQGKKFAIPIEAFSVAPDGELVNLNMDFAKLEAAPAYNPDNLRVNSSAVGAIYSYYGYEPYWRNRRIWRRGTMIRPIEEAPMYKPDLYSISSLLGKPVKDVGGRDVGKLGDLMVDLDTGYLASTILQAGGILGAGSKYYPLPLDIVSFDPVKKVFYLAVDKETIEEAPAFDKEKLPMIDRQGLIDIYAAYGYTPYWRERPVEHTQDKTEANQL